MMTDSLVNIMANSSTCNNSNNNNNTTTTNNNNNENNSIEPTLSIQNTQPQQNDFLNQEQLMWGKLVADQTTSPHIDLYEQDIYFGRNPRRCQVVLHEPTVSGVHCRIFREENGTNFNGGKKYVVKITDLSSNGTFVKGILLGKNKTTIIVNGDVISLTSPRINCGLSFTFADMRQPTPEEVDEIYKYYIIQHILGTGNFSVVKRCIRKESGQLYAVKIIDKKKFWHNGKNRNQIQSEISILKQVKHSNIISVIEVFDSDRYLYIILELASGGELFDKIKQKGQFSENEAKSVFKQILEAVSYLHLNNITHRDLKPENILIGTDIKGESIIKISDFGLAKVIGEKDRATTLCGTPLYVAPEIIKNCLLKTNSKNDNNDNNSSDDSNKNNNSSFDNVEDIGYGKEVDIWSLGCILYILLSGRPPFDVEKVTSNKILEEVSVIFDSPIWSRISEEAKDLIKKFLQYDPKKRIQTREALNHDWFLSNSFNGIIGNNNNNNNNNTNNNNNVLSPSSPPAISSTTTTPITPSTTLSTTTSTTTTTAATSKPSGSGSGSGSNLVPRELRAHVPFKLPVITQPHNVPISLGFLNNSKSGSNILNINNNIKLIRGDDGKPSTTKKVNIEQVKDNSNNNNNNNNSEDESDNESENEEDDDDEDYEERKTKKRSTKKDGSTSRPNKKSSKSAQSKKLKASKED